MGAGGGNREGCERRYGKEASYSRTNIHNMKSMRRQITKCNLIQVDKKPQNIPLIQSAGISLSQNITVT